MANPFLMDDEVMASNEPVSNPFLFDDAQDDSYTTNDNPFFGQTAKNPFAYDEEDNIDMPVTTTAPMDMFTAVTTGADIFMSMANESFVTTVSSQAAYNQSNTNFFDTTINDDDDLIMPKPGHIMATEIQPSTNLMDAYSSEEELKLQKPQKPPPPRPTPPSQATQQLINSIADQLDQTSNNLLRKIPATRTPSPVSMRDLHSPSPTPDQPFGDFLAPEEQNGQPQEIFNQQTPTNLFGDPEPENPFLSSDDIPAHVPQPEPEPIQKPPPPRPKPPRPAPPRKTSLVSSPETQYTATTTTTFAAHHHHAPPPIPPQPHQHQQAQQAEPDLFNFFGTSTPAAPQAPKPPAPKSKEDILSLFSAPAPTATTNVVTNQQPDLLSGDFDDINFGPSNDFVPNLSENMTMMMKPSAQEVQDQEPPNIIETHVTEPHSVEIEEPPTQIEENAMEIEENPPKLEISSEYSPPESNVTSGNVPSSASSSMINVAEATIEPVEHYDEVVQEDVQFTEQQEVQKTFMSPFDEPAQNEVISPFNEPVQNEAMSPFDEPVQNIVKSPFDEPVQNVVKSPFDEPVQNVVKSPFELPVQSVVKSPFDEPMDIMEQSIEMTQEVPEVVPQAYDPSQLDFSSLEPQISAMEVNPFAMPEPEVVAYPSNNYANELFGVPAAVTPEIIEDFIAPQKQPDEFDAFAAKFECTQSRSSTNIFLESITGNDDAFGGGATAWGNEPTNAGFDEDGFGNNQGFDDPFLSMTAPAQEASISRNDSKDSPEETKDFNVFIRPKEGMESMAYIPNLVPPPKSPATASAYSGDSSPRFNPFDKSGFGEEADSLSASMPDRSAQLQRSDSQETPPTPLFDEDVSQPLEDFPRVNYSGQGWEMQLRQPNKKKITGQRFWKKIFIRLVFQADIPVLQLFNTANDKEPFQELPLQSCYSVSDISAQQFDQYGKIFTLKVQYVFYKERPGVRPGQVTKAERLTNKLSQFAAYAIQGDYQGVKEFGSDLKKLGLPVEHAPQLSQLFKLGSMNYEDMKQFSMCIEEALFKLGAPRDRALTYKMEEVQITAVDELYVEQDAEGRVMKQIARVRLFFLAFLSGMPDIELGVNDLWRQGKEVVGRHDIIPVVTEEWIRLEGVEFHTCVQQDEYERSRTIKFKPPDACYIELMRFRIRPPKNRELPLQLKATWCVNGNKVELRADVLVPGFASRKLGQIPCEDVSIRFPIPECWIYLFRVEKHFRYGSVKSAHRRTGKIKGIERFLGTVETLQESLIEVTSGQAKYEHHHRAIVWRCPRLPKEGQGAYTTHQLVCRMALTSFDQIPEQLAPYAYVEFTMPATQASHTTVRSVSVQDSESDEPPEKYVRYLARHEYRIGIESIQGTEVNPYLAATQVKKPVAAPIQEEPMATTPIAQSDSDSDSN